MADLFSIPQIIGYFSLVTYVSAYLFQNDNKLKIAFSFSNLLWIAHYYLIGVQTAAFTTVVVTARNLLSLNAETLSEKRKLTLSLIFTVLLVFTGYVTWAGLASLIAVTACIAFTFAAFYLHGLSLRKSMFLIDGAWLVHAILVSSVSGFIYAFGALAVNAYTFYKMRQNKPETI